mgnify:CR=1 FL=1
MFRMKKMLGCKRMSCKPFCVIGTMVLLTAAACILINKAGGCKKLAHRAKKAFKTTEEKIMA